MNDKLLNLLISVGFINLAWSILKFLWVRLFPAKVKADLYVAYHRHRREGPVEKALFLVIRNDSATVVKIDSLVSERQLRRKLFASIPVDFWVVSDPLATIKPGKTWMLACEWSPRSAMMLASNYFGVHVMGGRTAWVKGRRLRRARREFDRDHPDWRLQLPKPVRKIEFKQYGECARNPSKSETESSLHLEPAAAASTTR
jgi:hypothetical protein